MEIGNHDEEGKPGMPMPASSSLYQGPSSTPTLYHHRHGSSDINAITVDGSPRCADNQPPPSLRKKTTAMASAAAAAGLIRYRECIKNHAAAMGGNATDGCGEFMPSGEEGSLEALTCSACGCHRNFHRKEVQREPSSATCNNIINYNPKMGRKLFLGHHHQPALAMEYNHNHHRPHAGRLIPTSVPPPHIMMSYNATMRKYDENQGLMRAVASAHIVKKRFRTKFSQEQKEKMLRFAENVGWKLQKQEEAMVDQFCKEIGVKRRILKVWMHNNKHNLAKKNQKLLQTTYPDR